MHFKKMS